MGGTLYNRLGQRNAMATKILSWYLKNLKERIIWSQWGRRVECASGDWIGHYELHHRNSYLIIWLAFTPEIVQGSNITKGSKCSDNSSPKICLSISGQELDWIELGIGNVRLSCSRINPFTKKNVTESYFIIYCQ